MELQHTHPSPAEPACRHRHHRARTQQQRRVGRGAEASDADAFFNLLTGPAWFDKVESLWPTHRERLFPPTDTLARFLSQALSADRSCQKVVNDLAVRRIAAGWSPCSPPTGADCHARSRLPTELVRTLVQYTGQAITARSSGSVGRWNDSDVT